jgi:hypothetical protein
VRRFLLGLALVLAPSSVAAQPAPPPAPPPGDQPPALQPQPPAPEPPPVVVPAPPPAPVPPVAEPPSPEPPLLPPQPPYTPPPAYEAAPPGYGPPGYGPPPPGYGYGYGPPPPPPEPEPECCFWSIRYDPFDLLFRRITFEAEIALGSLPLTLELVPSYIWSSPAEGVEEQGFDIGARFGWYIQGNAMRGFWLKAHLEFETFEAQLLRGDTQLEQYYGKPNPELCDADSATGTCKRQLHNFIVGLMLGTSAVFPKSGGFIIHGGIGIGVSVVDAQRLQVDPCTQEDVNAGNPHCPVADTGEILVNDYFDKTGRIRLLGNLALGVAF